MLAYLTIYIFPALLMVAAAHDLGSYRIPNWISVALAAAYLPIAILSGMAFAEIGFGLACGAVMLILGMGCFAMRLMGGGDAKVIAASALYVGFADLFSYLVYVGVIGGVFAVALLTFRRMPLPAVMAGHEWITRLHSPKEGIPYGVALAGAGILVFPKTSLYLALVS